MLLHDLDWRRFEQPVMSTFTSHEPWCRVSLYSPAVVGTDEGYRMWYCGNRSGTRTSDMDIGCADSSDGENWTACKQNPVLTSADLPWDGAWQTPHVLFDGEAGCFRMWFVMARSERDDRNQLVSFDQQLGHATSRDGIDWEVHPEPIYPSGRGPCVLRAERGWQMWMNSMAEPDGDFASLVSSIYRFESPDGLTWTRDPEPAVTANDALRSVVYPFVVESEGDYTLWYGCHVDGGRFEIYCSTSSDGITWTHHHDAPAFAASRTPDCFDGRYTSTPCVIEEEDRYLLYYSARDWGNLYGAGDGTVQCDSAGIYRHIGLAIAHRP
ncbi:MAG: hypothetical protein QGI83_18740 [Candidatus Latescibacteria bacterium]|jgi:hypothetical protein|nr:hypothetical protein [Candidatus Latescibacterota bacterium]